MECDFMRLYFEDFLQKKKKSIKNKESNYFKIILLGERKDLFLCVSFQEHLNNKVFRMLLRTKALSRK